MEQHTPAQPAQSATRTISLTVPLSSGERISRRIDGELVFDPADPYALELHVRPPLGPPVTWTFSRDLLAEGLHAPAGEGDVVVWPCLGEGGEAVVVIELRSPSGCAMLQTPSRPVHEFVARVLAAVPQGEEGRRIDLDEMVAFLLAD